MIYSVLDKKDGGSIKAIADDSQLFFAELDKLPYDNSKSVS